MYTFIIENFMGASITVTLVDGTTHTGEVTALPDSDSIIALKLTAPPGAMLFIDANDIMSIN